MYPVKRENEIKKIPNTYVGNNAIRTLIKKKLIPSKRVVVAPRVPHFSFRVYIKTRYCIRRTRHEHSISSAYFRLRQLRTAVWFYIFIYRRFSRYYTCRNLFRSVYRVRTVTANAVTFPYVTRVYRYDEGANRFRLFYVVPTPISSFR